MLDALLGTLLDDSCWTRAAVPPCWWMTGARESDVGGVCYPATQHRARDGGVIRPVVQRDAGFACVGALPVGSNARLWGRRVTTRAAINTVGMGGHLDCVRGGGTAGLNRSGTDV